MKKILLFIVLLLMLLSLYFFIPFGINELLGKNGLFIGFKYLTSILFLINIFLFWKFFYKNKKNIFILFYTLTLIIHTILIFIPAESCGDNIFADTKCKCIGLKKHKLFSSDCIGKIIK